MIGIRAAFGSCSSRAWRTVATLTGGLLGLVIVAAPAVQAKPVPNPEICPSPTAR